MPARPPMDAPTAPLQGAQLFSLPRRDYPPESDPCSNLWPLGDTHRISRVNGRSFYWRSARAHAEQRRLLVEWRQWLSELQRTRHLWWLEPEPSPRGWRLLRPLEPQAMAMTTPLDAFDRFERDQRFRRAVHQVARHYKLDRADSDQGVSITVTGGRQPYTVQLDVDGAAPPACTCPDAIHRVDLHGGYCKHVVAALLRWPDLRHQLLAAIL
jgi:hypothetical protein